MAFTVVLLRWQTIVLRLRFAQAGNALKAAVARHGLEGLEVYAPGLFLHAWACASRNP